MTISDSVDKESNPKQAPGTAWSQKCKEYLAEIKGHLTKWEKIFVHFISESQI